MIASPKVNGYYPSKAERRRESHKQTEQRQRDKINDMIIHLSKILPDCDKNLSKRVILAKACDYIAEWRTTNAQLTGNIEQPQVRSTNTQLTGNTEQSKVRTTNTQPQVHNAQITESIEQLQEHNAQLSANMQQLHAHNAQLIEGMKQLQEQNA